jgi:2-oxoglutarate dehydrogenase E1 component
MVRPYRKPLIVMSPKSLLRHPQAVSSLKELTQGDYQLMIPEVDKIETAKAERVILCSGKIYYELLEERRSKKLDKVAIIRIEQLYPFPEEVAKKILAPYRQVKQLIWCQEEPRNQGAWLSIKPHLNHLLEKGQVLHYAGRPPSASPAVGYHSVHEKEQKELIAHALMK